MFSCSKDNEIAALVNSSTNNNTSSDSVATNDTVVGLPFVRYIGRYLFINNCPDGVSFAPDTTVYTLVSFYVRNNNDTLLETQIGDPCNDCYPQNYDSLQAPASFTKYFFIKNELNHHTNSCELSGDSIYTNLRIFYCTIGHNCEIWSNYYIFEGVKAE